MAVKILGYKELSDGRIVGIMAPFTAMDEDSSTYTFIGNLIEAVETLESEAIAYLEGKHALRGTQLNNFDHYAPLQNKKSCLKRRFFVNSGERLFSYKILEA